jgi:adenylate kinase
MKEIKRKKSLPFKRENMIIGITGTHGAGKGTLTSFLEREYHFSVFSVSEFLPQELKKKGKEIDREQRGILANEYRAKGYTALMEAVYKSIPKGKERIVLEPQYTEKEVDFIKSLGGCVLSLLMQIERCVMKECIKEEVQKILCLLKNL